MAKKNQSVYVDEDVLKRMVAGDTSALEKMKEEEQPEEGIPLSEPSGEKGNKAVAMDKKSSAGKKASPEYGFDKYREQFLQLKLTGARRQTYIHDSLYIILAEVLPVIAPEMSVPTFVNSILSDHLEKYEDLINEMYNQKVTKKPVRWKK